MHMKNDGGPARPVVAHHEVYSTGMSLRDWFAGQAMQGLIANARLGVATNAAIAADAYAMADAMLAQRAKAEVRTDA